MKLSKTNANKFLHIISKSNKKVFTCEDLSKITGLKVDVIRSYIYYFYEMIQLDTSYNLKNIVPDLEKYIICLSKNKKKKAKRIAHSEYLKYSSFIDYVYKNMTSGGGILDTGYVLNAKDKKIIRYLLQKKDKK